MDEQTGRWLNYGSITDPSRDRESVIHLTPLTAIEREAKYREADIDEEVVEDVTKEMIELITGELKKQQAEEERIRRENKKTL